MPPSTEDTAELLSRIPVFAELGADDLGRVAQVAVPRALRRPAGHLPRGRRLRHVLHRALRPRARDPPALRRAHDHAGALRPRRHLRRAGDVRRRAPLGDRRGARRPRAPSRSPARPCAGCCERHPEIAVKLVIALGRRLRAANERLSRQSFQTVQSRVAAVLDQLVEQARAEGEGGERDVLVTATQAELAQLAGSSRESASRFLAVLERAGRDQPGARAADRARPRGAARLCLLSARSPSAASWCATATCS